MSVVSRDVSELEHLVCPGFFTALLFKAPHRQCFLVGCLLLRREAVPPNVFGDVCNSIQQRLYTGTWQVRMIRQMSAEGLASRAAVEESHHVPRHRVKVLAAVELFLNKGDHVVNNLLPRFFEDQRGDRK